MMTRAPVVIHRHLILRTEEYSKDASISFQYDLLKAGDLQLPTLKSGTLDDAMPS
jgi:hypothetical protein